MTTLDAWCNRIRERLRNATARARAAHELRAMSERELHDLGLSRSDIPSVVCGRFCDPGDRRGMKSSGMNRGAE